jgi:hypothetical protein
MVSTWFDVDSGKQYVGSAKGAERLLGRWMNYAAGGDGQRPPSMRSSLVSGPLKEQWSHDG